MTNNPYSPPKASVADVELDSDVEYVGFWARVGAAIIDGLLTIAITFPILIGVYGMGVFTDQSAGLVHGPAEFFISYVLPAVLTICFWRLKQATPGKMAISARIVDAKTGGPLSTGQSILRYVGYWVSALVIGLGFLWVAFDARKQGWHDKIAGTLVVSVRKPRR